MLLPHWGGEGGWVRGGEGFSMAQLNMLYNLQHDSGNCADLVWSHVYAHCMTELNHVENPM